MKGVSVATAWTELKSQPIRELAEKAFGAPHPEKYGEPMRDPELADLLDQFEVNVLALEVIVPSQQSAIADRENYLTGLIFRICESSRSTELDGPPVGEIATAQLQQTVTLHERTLRKIEEVKPSNAKLLEWQKHIKERCDLFAAELARRAPNRLMSGLLDQFERDLFELTSVRAVSSRSEVEENKLTGLVLRIREHTRDTGFLVRMSEVISTEQLVRVVDLHKRAAARFNELKPGEKTLAGIDQQIKERVDLFAGLLRKRQPK